MKLTQGEESLRRSGWRRQWCGLRKILKKKKNCCQILSENMLKFLTDKSPKGYKKGKKRHNNQKLWINMHNWRGFIITAGFKFTCIISCMLILIQWQWRPIFLPQKHFLIIAIKCQLQYQSQNIGLVLVTYFQKIMS